MNRPVNKKEMTSAQKKKREEIVLSMKKGKEDMKKRYGDKWEDVMYATATKNAIKDKKKVTEGVLDSTDDDGWMAKSQLYELAKYAVELHKMINDIDDLEPWVQAKLTSAIEDISTIKHYIEYLRTGGEDINGIVGKVDQQQALSEASKPTSRPMGFPEHREPSIEDIIRPVSESKKKKSLKNPKDNPCWDGYEPVGTKKLKGKTVPNCVTKK